MTTTIENQQLRSSYTDDQLRDALITATEVAGKIFVRGRTNYDGAFAGVPTAQAIADFHTLLHVLDTQDGEDASHLNVVLHAASDDWQPTSLADIDMTDEAVLALYADGTGIQGKPDGISDEVVCIAVNGQNVCVSREDVVAGKVWLYRIPAPVVHPDPREQPYILVHRADPKYNRHIFPNVGMSNGSSGYGVQKIHIPAEHVLEWQELAPVSEDSEAEPND